jgi:nitrate reductase alpha subunit
MKKSIINTFITALNASITADASLDTHFITLLKEHGFVVKGGESVTAASRTAAKVKALHATLKAALDAKYGTDKQGARKTAANRVSILSARFGVSAGGNTEKGKSKYSAKQFAATFTWLKKSFGLSDADLAGFLQAAAKAARK